MNNLLTVFLAPLGIVVIGLVVEYWIIQPNRTDVKSAKAKGSKAKSLRGDKADQTGSFRNSIARLLESTSNFSTYSMSAHLIEKVGLMLSMIPTFFVSIIATITAIPLFITLYFSEKHGNCKFNPSCKNYLVKAVEIHGPALGLWLSIRRVVKCNPFFVAGNDPVPTIGSNRQRQILLEDRSQLIRGFQVTLKAILFWGLIYFLAYGTIMPLGPKRLISWGLLAKEHLAAAIIFALFAWVFAVAVLGYLQLAFVRRSWSFVLTIYALIGSLLLIVRLRLRFF